MPPASLSQRVANAVGAEAGARLLALDDAERRLEALVERARSAWPGMEVDTTGYLAHAITHAAREGDLAGALDALRADDLYLAFAAAGGNALAIKRLEESFIDRLPPMLSRGESASTRDEVIQQLRARLLGVRETELGRPKLLDYAGRGPLGGWLRVAATRLSLDMHRRAIPHEVSEEVLLAIPDGVASPELELVRARHASAFNEAFRDALRELPDEDRNLLRLRLVDDLNIDEIAALFQVHRATAARWIVRTREILESRTRELLESRLGITPSELTSLLGVVRSYLDLSVGALTSADG